MRGALFVCALALTACASAAAQDSSSVCHVDSDCVTHAACCPACCACPAVMTRAQARAQDQACTVATCAAPDCSHRSCRACQPVHPACVDGACVAR